MIEEYFYESKEALTADLTRFCVEQVTQSQAQTPEVSIFLSGGRTPGDLYRALSNDTAIDWSNVHAALVDERWVDRDHAGSNEALLRRCFADNQHAISHLQGMKTSAANASAGQEDVESRYQALPSHWSFCLLGMGPDAHTASLFPLAQNLEQAIASDATHLVSAITANQSEVTGELVERMTLTLNGILKANVVILLITGEDKKAVYEQAKQATDPLQSPISAVLQQEQTPVYVFWAP